MIVLRMFGLSAILGGSAWIRARVAAVVKPFSVYLAADVVRGLMLPLIFECLHHRDLTINFLRE